MQTAQNIEEVMAPAHAIEPEANVNVNLASDEELEKYETMAAKIRFLATKTTQRGQIAKRLNIRYQWVRNVLETPLKK
jgi:DNA uptake protein ComE-like DNA-binding protein